MRYYAIFSLILLLVGCKGTYSTSVSGKQDVSFLLLLSDDTRYQHGITLLVDGQEHAHIDHVMKVKKQPKANPVMVAPGKHTLKIMQGNHVLYDKTIFLGVQETKKIIF